MLAMIWISLPTSRGSVTGHLAGTTVDHVAAELDYYAKELGALHRMRSLLDVAEHSEMMVPVDEFASIRSTLSALKGPWTPTEETCDAQCARCEQDQGGWLPRREIARR